MAIDNVNVIDGIAIDSSRNALVLLITDHLMWESENSDALSEYEHLTLKFCSPYKTKLDNMGLR